MAPLATNVDAIAVLDEIRAPQGVVLPPKEIKGAPPEKLLSFFQANGISAILEKTAGYVARNGIVFEGEDSSQRSWRYGS